MNLPFVTKLTSYNQLLTQKLIQKKNVLTTSLIHRKQWSLMQHMILHRLQAKYMMLPLE